MECEFRNWEKECNQENGTTKILFCRGEWDIVEKRNVLPVLDMSKPTDTSSSSYTWSKKMWKIIIIQCKSLLSELF